MGRWTQYDEDDYRLPSGFKRTGYDADTGQYTFEDHSGNTWNGAAHQEYGTLRRPNSPATMKPRTSSKPATKPATTGSLEEPWTSVTEEMAALNLSELNSNPMYPRTVSQRPNRFIWSFGGQGIEAFNYKERRTRTPSNHRKRGPTRDPNHIVVEMVWNVVPPCLTLILSRGVQLRQLIGH
ncbi:hypothetical protein BDP27DRAFT_1357231 [Rhodocollybia butyracea]|uniref:Uncharacterized protein n=1 Tax=Rhodocollybia butyracea TaxID=206335 RepID=A0A9P5Q9J7_9AGAR|nr:hypothetical protein BDP27DRAFT_1357231 [Rhodocollybia butyracea]